MNGFIVISDMTSVPAVDHLHGRYLRKAMENGIQIEHELMS